MQYTLGQARKRLSASSHAYGCGDVRDLINNAIQALSAMSGWECLRRVIRMFSVGPGFVLPQGCAGLVRACVNGNPSSVRGQDFRFLQSGPGDLTRPPVGFHPIDARNILDMGTAPVMFDVKGPFRLAAFVDGTESQPIVTVRGYTPDGTLRRTTLIPHFNASYDSVTGNLVDGTSDPQETEPDSCDYMTIEEVSLAESASKYVYLWATEAATGRKTMIGMYHPEVKAPEFRRYYISGVKPDEPVDILAETRIDPLPLIEDTDIVPLPCLEPIEWMIRADWQLKAGEATAAVKLQDLAAKWLKAQEVTNDTIQTQVVINSVFAGSPGEISMDSVNI